VPRTPSEWTAKRIQALRHALGESTTEFGARFARSRRTVEDWELGRTRPDALIQRLMEDLERTLNSKRR
jgi:DNA-binding transcriptional regulator YiaG